MSFIGNFAAAQSAKSIGAYNQSVYYEQAAYERKKAAVNKRTYDQVTKPLIFSALAVISPLNLAPVPLAASNKLSLINSV